MPQPQRYSITMDESGGNQYRIEDIWADNYAEALWIAYGRAMQERMAREASLLSAVRAR